jgi:hypothetical protein
MQTLLMAITLTSLAFMVCARAHAAAIGKPDTIGVQVGNCFGAVALVLWTVWGACRLVF